MANTRLPDKVKYNRPIQANKMYLRDDDLDDLLDAKQNVLSFGNNLIYDQETEHLDANIQMTDEDFDEIFPESLGV